MERCDEQTASVFVPGGAAHCIEVGRLLRLRPVDHDDAVVSETSIWAAGAFGCPTAIARADVSIRL